MRKWKKGQILEAHSQRNWMQKALMAPIYNFSVYGEILSMTVLSSMVILHFPEQFQKGTDSQKKGQSICKFCFKK